MHNFYDKHDVAIGYRYDLEDLLDLLDTVNDVSSQKDAYSFFDELSEIMKKMDSSVHLSCSPRFLPSEAKRFWRMAKKEADKQRDALVSSEGSWVEPGLRYRDTLGLEIGIYDDVGNYDPIISWKLDF